MDSLSPIVKQKGFTLLELIIVIVILGILAVTASSRFDGSKGFAEYTYQARLISSLRHMQQQAIQDTRPGYCFQINFLASPAAFGPPTLSYNSGAPGATCSTLIEHGNPDYLRTTASEMAGDGVTFGTLPFTFIGFDSFGRPLTDNGSAPNCSAGCQLDFVGEASVSVCIESQGYIHVCE